MGWDPGSRIRKNLSRIQGSKRHRIPDLDPQHCTLPVPYTDMFPKLFDGCSSHMETTYRISGEFSFYFHLKCLWNFSFVKIKARPTYRGGWRLTGAEIIALRSRPSPPGTKPWRPVLVPAWQGRGSRVHRCKKQFQDTFVKQVFQIFWAVSCELGLKISKMC